MAAYIYDVQVCSSFRLTTPFASRSPLPDSLLHLPIPLFTYLENQLLLLVVRIPIHSCLWFAINCFPLVASSIPRHHTDQVTYSHRRHQQHQPSCLIHPSLTKLAAINFLYIHTKALKLILLSKKMWQ
jgi:hypothetical protein